MNGERDDENRVQPRTASPFTFFNRVVGNRADPSARPFSLYTTNATQPSQTHVRKYGRLANCWGETTDVAWRTDANESMARSSARSPLDTLSKGANVLRDKKAPAVPDG